MAVAGLLLLAFFLYQAYMISEGRTTYETYKRNQLYKQLRAAAAQQQRQGSLIDSSSSSMGSLERLAFWRHRQLPVKVELPPNSYDRGFWANWYEVLCPEQYLQQFEQQQQQPQQNNAAKSAVATKKQR